MKPKDFLGTKVVYDNYGQMIFAKSMNGDQQLVADVRGWGHIQNMFRTGDKIDEQAAGKYQDEIGQFIADAINEKLEREK